MSTRPSLIWFRTGSGGGQTGVDPHLRIGRADDLECLLERWKPAHTRNHLGLFRHGAERSDGRDTMSTGD